MQNLPTALAAHLASETTTLATCWSITRRDGVSLYFTEHDQDIVVDGDVYVATSGMSASAITSQSGLSVDNLEIDGILSADAIREEDILAGRYDHAEISVFMVNYSTPTDGKLHLKTGWLGEVTLRNQQFTAEVRGLSSRLQQVIGDVYTKTCRTRFCDARCGLNIASFTVSGSVTASDSAHTFTDSTRSESGDYFAYGVVSFTSGGNAGLSMEVRDFGVGKFSLFLPLPQPISVGDAYTATAGCDKTFETCLGRFNNAIHFRGEPHVPGTDKILETSATRSS